MAFTNLTSKRRWRGSGDRFRQGVQDRAALVSRGFLVLRRHWLPQHRRPHRTATKEPRALKAARVEVVPGL